MFEFTQIDNEISKNLISPGVSGFIWIKPKSISKDFPLKENWKSKIVCMPEVYQNNAEKFSKFEVYQDDIWIITYPKCGTTWTQEMIWLIANDFDFNTAKQIDITDRSPFFEFNGVTSGLPVDFSKLVENLKRPRIIKSHLPSILLPEEIWSKKPKIVYVARNPKDVVVSFYHHFQHLVGYKGTLDDFAEAFLSNNLSYCPYSEHIMDFWKLRNESNILFLTFEDMKKDLKNVIRKCCDFLQKSYTEEQLDKLSNHLSFDEMKKNPKCNNQSLVKYAKDAMGEKIHEKDDFHFMRKGQVGSYKTELSENYIKRFNEWIEKDMSCDGFRFNEN